MKYRKVDGVIIPPLAQFSSSSDFFIALLELNKAQKPSMTGRTISKKLSWPVSYIIDVIKKRKTFSMQRASEFIRFAKFKNVEAERLYWISISESGDYFTQFFFGQKLRTNIPQMLLPMKELNDELLYFYVQTITVTLLYKNQKLSSDEILNLLGWKSVDHKKFCDAYNYVFSEGFVEWNSDKNCYFQMKEIGYDYCAERGDMVPFKGISINREFVKNFINFTITPKRNCGYFSGYLILSPEQFKAAVTQLIQFRNWLLELSGENSHLEKRDKCYFMQYDLNLFKMMD